MSDQVITIRPDHTASIDPLPENTLEFIQEACGGLVDVIHVSDGDLEWDVWVNDEFLLDGSTPNLLGSIVANRPVHGTVVVTTCDAYGATRGAPQELIDQFRVVEI